MQENLLQLRPAFPVQEDTFSIRNKVVVHALLLDMSEVLATAQ